MVMVICVELKHCLGGFVGFRRSVRRIENTSEMESKVFLTINLSSNMQRDHEVLMQCNPGSCYVQCCVSIAK
jgi:hypothetical protein